MRIELRWYEKDNEKVLQFRTAEIYPYYSQWETVPTVIHMPEIKKEKDNKNGKP